MIHNGRMTIWEFLRNYPLSAILMISGLILLGVNSQADSSLALAIKQFYTGPELFGVTLGRAIVLLLGVILMASGAFIYRFKRNL